MPTIVLPAPIPFFARLCEIMQPAQKKAICSQIKIIIARLCKQFSYGAERAFFFTFIRKYMARFMLTEKIRKKIETKKKLKCQKSE